jgi:hypothetical protein
MMMKSEQNKKEERKIKIKMNSVPFGSPPEETTGLLWQPEQ